MTAKEDHSDGVPLVSVIVPCFRVERYLRQCLDSIVNQTLDNIEIILVNDGSPDNSLSICQAYAAKDSRIKIIDQENQGSAVARNHGLNIASGKYVLFVDSDDYLDLSALKKLTDRAEFCQSEVVFYSLELTDETGFISFQSDYFNFSKFHSDSFSRECFCCQDCHRNTCTDFPVSVSGYLILRLFLVKHSLRFPLLRVGEDNLFFKKIFFLAKRMSILEETLYFYRQHSESIMANMPYYFEDEIEMRKLELNMVLQYAPLDYSFWEISIVDGLLHRFQKLPFSFQNRFLPVLKQFFMEHKVKDYEKNLNAFNRRFVKLILFGETIQFKWKDRLKCYLDYYRYSFLFQFTIGRRKQHYLDKKQKMDSLFYFLQNN